jgi:amidohydrolase
VAALIQLAGAFQTIVNRNVSPLDTAVLSIGTIHGGTAFNIIPGQVALSGTVRTFKSKVREKVVNRMEVICRGIASAMDVELDLDVQLLVPAVVNDPAATELIRGVAYDILDQGNVRHDYRTMVSEDMSFFLREVPGCYIYLGASNAQRGLVYGHHHPCFDFDEAVLPLGVAILTETAARLLRRNG